MSTPVIPPNAKPLRLLDDRERVQRAGVARPGLSGLGTQGRKPEWLKVKANRGEQFKDVTRLMADLDLNTVCQQAACPNIYECWEDREATFLIGGDDCTRRCGFCQIKTGKPDGYDKDEPRRVAEAVAHLKLRYAVVTMVARDDLDDGGAWLVAETIRQLRKEVPGVGVEVLPSDFGYGHNQAQGLENMQQVVDEAPEVFAFNVETCRRLHPTIRPGFSYDTSIDFLRKARERFPAATAIKSNIIVGMGETDDEVLEVMRDMRDAGVQLLTIGQYLQPSAQHLTLERYVTPEQFQRYADEGAAMGFDHVESGPMVRSSYHAGVQAMDAGTWAPSGDQPGALQAPRA